MVFVFAALAEFVVVKVLDVQYQQQVKQPPKPILPLRLTSTMEKGQCQTVAVFDGHGTNVRSRKANAQTPTTPIQVTTLYLRFQCRYGSWFLFSRPTCKATEVTSPSIEGSRFYQSHGLTMIRASRRSCGERSTSCHVLSFQDSFSCLWSFIGQF